MKKLIVFIFASLMLSACTEEKVIETTAPATEKITLDELSDESNSVRAERYVQLAEKLVSPNGFMYAHEIFEKAFELDPTNIKAQFFLRLLKPMVMYKGFYLRIQPLMDKIDTQSRDDMASGFNSIPTGSLKSFLLREGGALIENEEDLQKFTLQLDVAYKEFREFLKKEKTRVLSLRVVGTRSLIDYLRECSVTRIGDKSFQISPCQHAYEIPVSLDSGDFEALQQMTAGMQLTLKTFNSYQMNGALEVQKKYTDIYPRDPYQHFIRQVKAEQPGISDQQAYDELIQRGYGSPWFDTMTGTPGQNMRQHRLSQLIKAKGRLGRLKDKHYMNFVGDFGAEFLGAFKWAVKYQKFLCPDDTNSDGSRPGRLFSKGICTGPESEVKKAINILELGLAGKSFMYETYTYENGMEKPTEQKIEVNWFALLVKPAQDIKAMIPDYSCDNKPVRIADPTFGGTFPNSDILILATEESVCEF